MRTPGLTALLLVLIVGIGGVLVGILIGTRLQTSEPTAGQLSQGARICNQYDAASIPPGYDENGCWAPTEYFEAAPEVIPDVEPSAPTIRIEASGTAPYGIEGSLFFVRAASPTGRIVLEQQWEWPEMEQQIPPGAYQVTTYVRACDANCGYLDPAFYSCTVDVLAEPSMTYTVTYDVQENGTFSCAVDH